jgi:hypothetical protein
MQMADEAQRAAVALDTKEVDDMVKEDAISNREGVVHSVHERDHQGILRKWSRLLSTLQVEKRGLQRVPEAERARQSPAKIAALSLLWYV